MLTFLKNFFFTNSTSHQTVTKNASWLLIGEIGSRFLKLFLVIYAARILDVAGWGGFSYALSTVFICCFLADAGLSSLITREYANNKEVTQYKQTIVLVKLLLLVISFLIVLLVSVVFMKSKGLFLPSILLGIFILVDSLRDFIIAIARGRERMELEAFTKMGSIAVTMIVGIALLSVRPSIVLLAIAYIIGSSTGIIIVGKQLWPLLRYRPIIIDRVVTRTLIKASLLFGIILLTNVLIINEDTIIVGWLMNFHATGLYAAGQKIIQFLYVLPAVIVSATLPTLSKHIHDQARYQAVYSRVWQLLLFLALPFAIGGAFFSKDLLVLLFGNAYSGGAASLSILFLSLIPVFPSMLIVSSALALGKHVSLIGVSISANVIHVVLVFLLVRVYGIEGAAFATTIALSLLLFLMSRKFIPIRFPEYSFSPLKLLASLILMSATILLLHSFHASFIPTLLACTIVYCASLLFLREPVSRSYLQIGKEMLRR